MLKKLLSVDSKFYSEELEPEGKTNIRISFFLFSRVVKSVCDLSEGETEELRSSDMIGKTSIVLFICFACSSVVYWTRGKTGGANPSATESVTELS